MPSVIVLSFCDKPTLVLHIPVIFQWIMKALSLSLCALCMTSLFDYQQVLLIQFSFIFMPVYLEFVHLNA